MFINLKYSLNFELQTNNFYEQREESVKLRLNVFFETESCFRDN